MLSPALHYVGRPNFALAGQSNVQPDALAFWRDTVSQLIRHLVYILVALGVAAPAGAMPHAPNQCLVAPAWHQSTTPAQSADTPRPEDEEEEEEDEEPDCD